MSSEAKLPQYIYAPTRLQPMPGKLAPAVHPLHGPYHRITWGARATSPHFPEETWDEEYTYLKYVVDADDRPIAIIWMRVDDEGSVDVTEELRHILNHSGELRIRRELPRAN